MHIKNNVFENIFSIVMEVKEKIKDNIKFKMDIPFFYHRKNIELVYNESQVAKIKANFVLDNNAQLFVNQCLKSLPFSIEHASNISRLVNLKYCRLYRMKSYDCHVFI